MGSRNQMMISFAHDSAHHFPLNNIWQEHEQAEDNNNNNSNTIIGSNNMSPIDAASVLFQSLPSSKSPWISENQMNRSSSSSSSLSANLRYMEGAGNTVMASSSSHSKAQLIQSFADHQGRRRSFSHDYLSSENSDYTKSTWLGGSAGIIQSSRSHHENGRPAAADRVLQINESYVTGRRLPPSGSHLLINTRATSSNNHHKMLDVQGVSQLSEGNFNTSSQQAATAAAMENVRSSALAAAAAGKAQTSGVVILSPPSHDNTNNILDFLLPDNDDGIPSDYNRLHPDPVLSAAGGSRSTTADTCSTGKETSSSAGAAAAAAAAAENQLKIAADLLDFDCCRRRKDMGDDVECGEVSQPQRRPSKRSRVPENHNLSEKRRRNRINEKLRNLQKLIPNSTKTDKASILDEVIEYLKTLRLQLQMISSRRDMLTVSPAGIISLNGAPTDVKASNNINEDRQCPAPPSISSSSMLQQQHQKHYPLDLPPQDVSGFRSLPLMAAAAADNYEPCPISANCSQPNREEGDENSEELSAGLADAYTLDATFIANCVVAQDPQHQQQHSVGLNSPSTNATYASYSYNILPLSQTSSRHFGAEIEAQIHGASVDDFQYLYRHLHHELGDDIATGFHRHEYRDIHEEAAAHS